jgi:SAM-dependent methyltransferase
MRSVSFDRAADNYEQTRGFPPGVAAQVADAAHRLLGRARRVVEVGVGTGRIARPLLERGLPVVGIDLSAAMMRRLLAALPAGWPAPGLAQGDAVHLPLAAAACDAVISVHVFHLLASWRAAVDEVRRVLRPGGVFLTGYDWRPADSPGAQLMARWQEIVRAAGWLKHYPPMPDFDDIRAELLASGARLDEVQAATWSVRRTLAQQIETIEHRTWSYTWDVPDDFFPVCLAELRAWAAGEFGGLDAAFDIPRRFIWQRFAWADPEAG